MKKQPKAEKHPRGSISETTDKRRPPAVLGVVTTLIVGASIAAYATNDLLHGRVTKSEQAAQTKPASVVGNGAEQAPSSHSPSALEDKYGSPASSPKVAAEIKNAEGIEATKTADQRIVAERKADAYEKLERGIIDPANPPPQLEIIRRGLVPPGMLQQQAAVMYNSLPNNLKMPYTPQPGSPEWLTRVTREPVDPLPALPDETTPDKIRAANEAHIQQYMRETRGPGGQVPSHGDHSWLAQHAKRTPTGWVVTQSHQMSLIEPQYGLDPDASPTGSIREMTDQSGNVVWQGSYDPYGHVTTLQGTTPPDFMYQGMYHLQRPDLYLTAHRVYSQALGRWMSRDPIEDPTFRMMPQSPEPSTSMIVNGRVSSPELMLATAQIRSIPVETRRILGSSVVAPHLPLLRSQLLLSRSSSKLTPNVPDSNLYIYVHNDPINFSDPSGLGDWAWCKFYCDQYANSSALAWLICMMWCMDNMHQPPCPPPYPPPWGQFK